MFLLTDNSLFLTDPQQRGQQRADVLQNVRNLPQNLRDGLIKVLVLPQKAENGQTQLQLPSGQVFTADVPDNIPAGSQLLIQLRGGQQLPQILRVLLPQTADQPAQIRPSETPSVLLDVAKNTAAAEGQTVRFNVPQNSSFLPSPGVSVMGRTLTPPQLGGQTISLTNGQQLSVLVPPVFEINSEVVLKIGQNQTAIIDKLRLPQPQQIVVNTPSTNAQATEEGPQNQPRQFVINREAVGEASRNQGRTELPTPIKLRPQSPIPQALLQNTGPQLVTVQQYAPNSVTIGLQNGVLLTFDIPEEVLLNRLGFQPQVSTTQTQLPTQQMAIRFTDSGLMEVLSTVSPRVATNVAGRNPEQQQQQQFPNPQGQAPTQAPQQSQGTSPTLSTGHIATGTVVEQRPGGEVVLQFGQNVRTSVIAQRLLPVGSQISVHIMPDGHAEILDMVLPKGSERSNALLRFSLQWDTLNQALTTLEDSNPGDFEKLKRTLPQANEKLLPKLLQLSQSITQQNMRAFFGDDVLNVLRALGLDGMLQNDTAQLNNLHQKPDAPDGWRALMFPYLDDQDRLRQGGFFWRRHKKESANDETSLRFVLNVHMSNMGPVQLDGLMQGKDVMHIKLRMTDHISDTDKQNLNDLVQKSLEAVGLSGSLKIETVTFFETDPIHEMLVPVDDDAPHNRLNVEA